MDGVDGLLEALGRLIADRFAQTTSQQTGDLLTGGGTLLDQFFGKLAGGFIEWVVRAFFLVLGIAARALLLAFGDQATFLQGLLVGAPAELTHQLPGVQATVGIARAIAFAALPAAVAWTGLGYEFSWTHDGLEGFVKRVFGGGVLAMGIVPLMNLSIDAVNALGHALAGAGTVAPGYDTVTAAATESITVAAALTPMVTGGIATPLSQDLLGLASNTTVVAGALALVYALAAVFAAGAAAGRIVVLDALYCLGPLAAVALVTPVGGLAFAIWARAYTLVLLIVLPAGLVLKLASEMLVTFTAGGPIWAALIGAAAVFLYAGLVGRACWGLTFSTIGTAGRLVRHL